MTTQFLKLPKALDREALLENFVNERLGELDAAAAGYTDVSLAGLSGNVDLTPTQARHRRIRLTGNPSAAVTLRIPHATGANCDIIFANACGGSFSTVTVKSTGANAGNPAGVSLTTGRSRIVAHNGESAYAAEDAVFQGTFTPTIAFNGAAVGVTYSTQLGTYSRVGNVVHVNFRIILTNKGSSVSNLTLKTLPVAPATTPNLQHLIVGIVTPATYTGTAALIISGSASTTDAFVYAMNNGTPTQLTNAAITNTSDFSFNGFYFAG